MNTPDPEAALWLAVDVVGALALFAAACFALGTGIVRPRRVLPFWIGAATGLVYLAGDERFSLHERTGRWLHARNVPTPLGLNHMDDAVLLAAAFAGLAWVLLFRHEALANRPFARVLAIAAGASAAALAIDSAGPVEGWGPRVEEPLELLAQLLLLTAFGLRWAEIRQPVPAPPLSSLAHMRPSDRVADDVPHVAQDVTDRHALDDEPQRASHSPG